MLNHVACCRHVTVAVGVLVHRTCTEEASRLRKLLCEQVQQLGCGGFFACPTGRTRARLRGFALHAGNTQSPYRLGQRKRARAVHTPSS